MAARLLLMFICVLQTLPLFFVSSTLLCEAGFCTKYRQENTCPTTARDCSVNNATFSGLTLPSPTICNCCDYCLPLYNKGEPCSLGGPGDGVTVGRCGHGLTCDNGTRTCVRMSTKCHDAQDDYDARHAKGETGVLERRPECDIRGDYATYDCVPSQT
ncbi:jg17041 [Pararge aegeria aegeria]|uniref:Jg17041 protein n=2 Tax=Pararge aegeria TaxID=116150 RepID=A0A8S4R6H1_9NEOP|nr:jg17041 [Pararge aegeria aegeria]